MGHEQAFPQQSTGVGQRQRRPSTLPTLGACREAFGQHAARNFWTGGPWVVVWWVLLPRPRRVTSPPLASLVVAPSAASNLKSACWYLVSPLILVFASTVVAGTSVVHTSRHGQICFIYWMGFGSSLSLTEFVLDGRSKWASRGGWGDRATHFHFHATPIVECSTDGTHL